jgi:hypothetical protein
MEAYLAEDYPDRQENWAETISPENIFELGSCLFILERGFQDKGGVERLHWHVDKSTCQKND